MRAGGGDRRLQWVQPYLAMIANGVVHTLKHAVTHLFRSTTASPNPSTPDNVSDDDEAGGYRRYR